MSITFEHFQDIIGVKLEDVSADNLAEVKLKLEKINQKTIQSFFENILLKKIAPWFYLSQTSLETGGDLVREFSSKTVALKEINILKVKKKLPEKAVNRLLGSL